MFLPTNVQRWLVWILSPLYVSVGFCQVFTVKPQNTVGVKEQNLFLHCGLDDVPGYNWAEFVSNPDGPGTNIYLGQSPVHPDADKYTLTSHGTSAVYNLGITNLTLSDAGKYRCQGLQATTVDAYAYTIVLDSDPDCGHNESAHYEFVEGEKVEFWCHVIYRGVVAPQMNWTEPWLPPVAEERNNESLRSSFSLMLTADFHDNSFICVTFFSDAPPAESDHAENVPEYTNLCATPALKVLYAPRHIVISGGPYYVGDVVTCYADANPALAFANYTWVVMETDYVGQTLMLQQDMAGVTPVTCCGKNTIRDQPATNCETFVIEIEVPNGQPTANCSDVTGRWVASDGKAQMLLSQAVDDVISGTHTHGINWGWYALHGRKATNKPTFGFTVVSDGGSVVTSWAGQCYTCSGEEVLHTKMIRYSLNEGDGICLHGKQFAYSDEVTEQTYFREL